MPRTERPETTRPDQKRRFVRLCRHLLAVGTVVALAAPATGVVTLDIVAPAPAPAPGGAVLPAPAAGGSLVASEPVRPDVTSVPVSGVDPEALADLDAAGGSATRGLRLAAAEPVPNDLAALSAPEPVDGLGTVGVTWARDEALSDDEITVRIRTQKDGAWSGWEDVPYHDDHGPDPDTAEGRHARPGTDSVYVGDVDDVQMMAVTETGQPPADLELELVDPGQEQAPTVQRPAIDTGDLPSAAGPAGSGADATVVSASTGAGDPAVPDGTTGDTATPTDDGTLLSTPAYVTPKPQIYSRAQWGADERMRDKSSLHYFEVHAGFVHHTVNANGYTRAQVPSIIRGIYAYHTQSRGWSDVGYNFLVDRFGRIWEGRYGGVDRPVVGAHTLGYNDYAFAMSAIGNFETARPSSALLDAYGRLFAWKLSLHGVDAGSMRQWVGKRYLPAINGHRDVGQTACPGRYLYAKISTIRSLAARYERPFSTRSKDADLSGTRWPDLVVRDAASQRAYVVRTGGQLSFARPRRAATGFGDKELTLARDLTGDGVADLLARSTTDGLTGVHPGDGSGHFGAASSQLTRFVKYDRLVGVGDFDGDGRNDVAARRTTSKALFLFPGNGTGGFGHRRLLADDWSGYDLTTGLGDFDGDGHVDLAARSGSRLQLFAGRGRSGLDAPRAIPGSWAGFDVVSGLGDATNDGRPDIVARKRKSQRTYVYPGSGTGGLGHPYGPYTAFKDVDFLATAGQVTGTRDADLVGRNARGRVVVFENSGGHNLGRVLDTGTSFTNTNLVLNVGDWNGDGHGDVITRAATSGYLYFRAGNGRRRFADPVLAHRGFGNVRLVSAVGDITGDGAPDLMGQPAGGAMRIYPGNGGTGFRRSYVAHAAISSDRQVGVGLWNSDGSPDTVVRRSDGTLAWYAGNGPGGLTGSGRKAASHADRYDWLQGSGDADGDGNPDIIARDGGGTLWLLPGDGSGGFGPRRFIAEGLSRYDLGG
jgi:hypothetical protein